MSLMHKIRNRNIDGLYVVCQNGRVSISFLQQINHSSSQLPHHIDLNVNGHKESKVCPICYILYRLLNQEQILL